MEVLADGVHEVVRWWLQRFDDPSHLPVITSGFDGAAYVAGQGELTVASPAAVALSLDRMLAVTRTSRARQAAKRQPPQSALLSPPIVPPSTSAVTRPPWPGELKQQLRPWDRRGGGGWRLL